MSKDSRLPRLIKQPRPTPTPPGVRAQTTPAAKAAAPAQKPPTPPPPHPGFQCPAPNCTERVKQRGYFCPEHWAWQLSKRFASAEAPTETFTCIVPGCAAAVPHRDFICESHWQLVDSRRRWKIQHFAALYRTHLGLALEEIVEKLGKAATSESASVASEGPGG